jgi:hypothetical protein
VIQSFIRIWGKCACRLCIKEYCYLVKFLVLLLILLLLYYINRLLYIVCMFCFFSLVGLIFNLL